MDLLAGLGTILPEDRVVSTGDDLERHGGGVFTYHAPVHPDVVVYPESRDEVVGVLRFANEHLIPIVPFGKGSSLEAHTLPVHGGISLDLGRMDRILEVRPDDFIARVQPGQVRGYAGPDPRCRSGAGRRDGDAYRRNGYEVLGRIRSDRALRGIRGDPGCFYGVDP